MARRLWSALLLACLFSNIASAQILARPDLDNHDPVRCFDHVWRDARNAVQAYQIVYAPGWKDEVACHGKVPAPDREPCWPPVLQARPLIEQAATLFERAPHTYAPEQGQLVAQANALIRQAAGLLDQGGKCFQPIFARWQQNGGRYVPQLSAGAQQNSPLERPPDVLSIKIPTAFSIFVPGIQNIANAVNFLSTYHPVETAYVGIAIAGGRLAMMTPPNPVQVIQTVGGTQYTGTAASIRAADAAISREAPLIRALDRPISGSATQNQVLQDDIAALQKIGARDFRVNQQQVTANGQRVGINRPDLQFTYRGQRYYVEYDTPPPIRAQPDAMRILANDPNATIILKTVP